MVNQDSARRRTIGQSERGVNLVTRRDLAHEYSYEWLMMMMWGLKSSDVGLTVTNGDDDELMLNVLRCHLTY